MTLFRKHIDFVRLVVVLVAGTFLSACMTWQTQSLRPERFHSADSTQAVRLTLTSGDRIMVHAPVITRDSLVGMQTRSGASPDSLERVSIPLTAIRKAEMKTNDPAGKVRVAADGLLATGLVVALVGIAVVVVAERAAKSAFAGWKFAAE